MRSTENVRGEWDELGERETRVLVPGPGTGGSPGQAVPGDHGVRLPEPGAEPEPVVAVPPDAPVDAVLPEEVPEAGDPLVEEALPAVDAPPCATAARSGCPEHPESSPEPGPAAVADEDVPADLGPALDAVAVVGPAAPVELDLDVGAGPEPGPSAPAPGPRPGPVPPEPLLPQPALMEQVPDTLPGTVADPGEGAEEDPGGGVPGLGRTAPGTPRLSGDEMGAPVALTVGAADPVAWWGTARRQPVIATETTATIPVHLLFRDDDPGTRVTGPGGTTAGTGAARRPGDRRPPVPRSPQVQAPTRPSPLADPRLTERPGPVLPGWAALFTAAAGVAAGLAVLWWQGALPAAVTGRLGLGARPDGGIGAGAWALLALLVVVVLFTCCGLGRGRAGHASVLTLCGGYRGSVRRTGLLWISPLLRRRRIDVRLRHWRSEPLPAVDASGTALRVEILVVWRVKDTARAALGVADHERYLRDQVEAALARVLSQLPADAFHEDTHTLRDAEAVGDALTRMLKADCAPVGVEVYSAQPTGIEYAPEVAAAMRRCRVAAIDAKHRDGVLTSVVDAVDDTVGRLTARGIVELDAYEHKALVRDLTVAFYTGRSGGDGV
ncbi:SPFH domain-containing protein [Streptomyces sp. NPDC060030]|uniref:SPFH domain-containing protein n=1 Tax=Streptomyces sp. NPDC060030 TaxID=3347042 RepID=UPI0036C2E25E